MAMAVGTPTVRPRMTWKEICKTYPNQWVVLAHMAYDDNEDPSNVLSAVVLGHSQTRAQCIRDTRDLYPDLTHRAHLHTGMWPEGPPSLLHQ